MADSVTSGSTIIDWSVQTCTASITINVSNLKEITGDVPNCKEITALDKSLDFTSMWNGRHMLFSGSDTKEHDWSVTLKITKDISTTYDAHDEIVQVCRHTLSADFFRRPGPRINILKGKAVLSFSDSSPSVVQECAPGFQRAVGDVGTFTACSVKSEIPDDDFQLSFTVPYRKASFVETVI